MVKPLQEEASMGISQASLVDNEKDLRERVQFVHDKFDMAAIAEEYIDGMELYVSIMGKKRLQIFSLREMKFSQVPEDGPKLATYKAKWDNKYRKKWGITNEFAGRLPNGAIEKITKICKKAYRALMINGYGRFDLRLTASGDVYIIRMFGLFCHSRMFLSGIQSGQGIRKLYTKYHILAVLCIYTDYPFSYQQLQVYYLHIQLLICPSQIQKREGSYELEIIRADCTFDCNRHVYNVCRKMHI